MTLVELLARARWGLASLVDWQENQTMASWMTGRPMEASTLAGLGFHLLHGLIAGIVFVLLLPLVPVGIPAPIPGLGFGVVLWGIGLALFRPIMAHGREAGPLGWIPVVVSLATHLVYGAALALLVTWA